MACATGLRTPSKTAVMLLTKCITIDQGHENIRVNAICPSFVEIDLTAAVTAERREVTTEN
jgi:NAD(P)-dependent dehydrogenase (short-subunit alcohol dehydrogenase family)